MFELSGRTALVTGAGQGVGAGICGEGGSGEAIAFDVTDADAVQHAVGARAIDVVVHNAGIPADGMQLRPFRQMNPAEWRRYVDLNLYGVLHVTRAVLGGMCERRFGRIFTISSEAGRLGIPIGISLYGAAKAAAVAFTRHLAMEVAPFGVTATALSLGAMDNIPEPMRSAVAQQTPTRRVGTPDDVGAAVVYLASNEASWVTGQLLPVNGGFAA